MIEHIYKRMFDHNGNMLEKIVNICEDLDISPSELQVNDTHFNSVTV